MLVAIVDIKLKDGVESEFREWFSRSNQILSKTDGFVSRRLLKSQDGTHRIIVEHQNRDTFEAMHKTKEHAQLHEEAISFMESAPFPKLYDVIAK